MEEMKSKAKRKMLEALKKEMMDMDHEGMSEKMKVSVMSDSPEGLEEGLDKAKDLLKKRAEMMKHDDKESKDMDYKDSREMYGEGDYGKHESRMSKDEKMEMLKKYLKK